MAENTLPADGRLALRAREAAVALGVSPRLLWQLTNAGVIPHTRLGAKVIVYPVRELQDWLGSQAAKEVRP